MASITNLENFDSDQHFTPSSIFEKLNLTFDLDVAAYHSQNHVPAKAIYCKCCHDGLKESWSGLVWMNPPYSKPTPWVEKFLAHANGLALLPITRGRWWDSIWQSEGLIIPSAYNFKFERPDGVKRDITFRTMLFAIGQTATTALQQSGLGRVR